MQSHADDAMPHHARCFCCGRYYDLNEVHLGAYTDYYLAHGPQSPCPSCFSQMIHGVKDPVQDNLLLRRLFSDTRFSLLLRRVSVWHATGQPSHHES